jgi:hypothetical protein
LYQEKQKSSSSVWPVENLMGVHLNVDVPCTRGKSCEPDERIAVAQIWIRSGRLRPCPLWIGFCSLTNLSRRRSQRVGPVPSPGAKGLIASSVLVVLIISVVAYCYINGIRMRGSKGDGGNWTRILFRGERDGRRRATAIGTCNWADG